MGKILKFFAHREVLLGGTFVGYKPSLYIVMVTIFYTGKTEKNRVFFEFFSLWYGDDKKVTC